MSSTAKLQERIGYEFKNPELLNEALTHPTYAEEHGCMSNQRLEFLGDRVLGLTIAALLYRMFPNEPEGSLSQRHTGLVNKDCVSETARRLGLDRFVIVANEEIRENENVLCDVCEAVIGAIFIDAGCEQAVEFVNEHWKELIDKNVAPPKDAKTLLQETAHNLGLGVPQYRLVSREGSEHEPLFHMEVVFPGGTAEAGSGRNKKLAEQEAAAKMLAKLGIKNG